MPVYVFEGRDHLNQVVTGEMEAPDQAALVALLRRRQIILTRAREKEFEVSLKRVGRDRAHNEVITRAAPTPQAGGGALSKLIECPTCKMTIRGDVGYRRCPECSAPLPDHLRPASATSPVAPQPTAQMAPSMQAAAAPPACPRCGATSNTPFCRVCGTPVQSVFDDGLAAPPAAGTLYGGPPPYQPPAYGAPMQPAPGYGYNAWQQPLPEVKNHLVESILTTLLCCLPLGIAAIIYSSQVNTKLAAGDYEGAVKSAKTAHTLNMISLGVGLVIIGLKFIGGFLSAL